MIPKPPRILSGIAAALLLSLGANAHAINLGFLRDTPISALRQADFDSLVRAIRESLSAKADGESTSWNNDGLRNRVRIESTITPTTTEKTGGSTCRNTDVELRARGQSLTVRPRFCRQGESGQWVFQKQH